MVSLSVESGANMCLVIEILLDLQCQKKNASRTYLLIFFCRAVLWGSSLKLGKGSVPNQFNESELIWMVSSILNCFNYFDVDLPKLNKFLFKTQPMTLVFVLSQMVENDKIFCLALWYS